MKPTVLCVDTFAPDTSAESRPPIWPRRSLRAGACLLLLLGTVFGSLAPTRAWSATNEASQVVILYNTNEKRSREVADFYARQRGVPTDHIIGFACTRDSYLSRTEFETQIQEPLRQELIGRQLANFASEIVPSQPGRPGKVRFKLVNSKIRYLLLVYGMPYRITHDTNIVEALPPAFGQSMRNNGSCVDSDLMLLPITGNYNLTGAAQNPFYGGTNAALIHPGKGAFLVSRLDGPTPELAMGLVTKAMEAERNGLWGRAYLDLRGIKGGAYKVGDDWLGSAENICKVLGFDVYVDRTEATFTAGFPLSEVAVYGGWYEQDASGPFTLPTVEFAPGAIAYHIHSYSAGELRSTNRNWVGPLIAKGATVTMGCVDEPYLQLTPNFGLFLARFASGMNFAEAGICCLPILSWQNILVGDPLYRPFAPNLFQRAEMMERTNSPLLPWAIIQKLNYEMTEGRDPNVVIQYLEELPASATNAALAEKVARLYESKSRLKQSVEWGKKALAAGGTPQQRVRLLLDLAEWQHTLDKPADRFETLAQFAREFPGHPRILTVRRQQLDLARELNRSNEVATLKAEIERLNVLATNAPKASP